ncbi:MAG: hypothetical protein NVS1B10_08760 [Candidatus Saccharimonadales bacterium]
MTQAQYKKYLKLPQYQKKQFIELAKKAPRLSDDTIYWLELGYAVHDKTVRKGLFEAIQAGV